MCSTDEVQPMVTVELGDNVRPKSDRHTPIILTPPLDILVWV